MLDSEPPAPAFDGPNYLVQKREMRFDRSRLPQGFDGVVSRALEAESAKRFHTGAEFASALGALV